MIMHVRRRGLIDGRVMVRVGRRRRVHGHVRVKGGSGVSAVTGGRPGRHVKRMHGHIPTIREPRITLVLGNSVIDAL